MKMKRIVLALTLVLAMGLNNQLSAQKDRALTNGFSINFNLGFPSASYGDSEDVVDEYKFGALYGLELGNRWYFSPSEKVGFGLMVNWIDFSYAVKTVTEDFGVGADAELSRATLDLTFFEIGPLATYALGNSMALDGYYNLRPTTLISGAVASGSGMEDETFAYAGFGITHAIGGAFRWKAVNIGLEYVMGSVNAEGTYSGSLSEGDLDLDEEKLKAGNFRLKFGFKF